MHNPRRGGVGWGGVWGDNESWTVLRLTLLWCWFPNMSVSSWIWAWQQGDSAPAARRSVRFCHRAVLLRRRGNTNTRAIAVSFFPQQSRPLIFRNLAEVGSEESWFFFRKNRSSISLTNWAIITVVFLLESWYTDHEETHQSGTWENEPYVAVSGGGAAARETVEICPSYEHLMEQMCLNCNQ